MKPTYTDKYNAPCAHYLVNALFDHKKNLKEAAKNLKAIEFDTIVVTGVSGLVFGIPLAQKLGKHIVVVRKAKDGTHSYRSIEATTEGEHIKNWLFVDDLVDTGKTKKRVLTAMKNYTDDKGIYVGDYLYQQHNLRLSEKKLVERRASKVDKKATEKFWAKVPVIGLTFIKTSSFLSV